MDPTLPLRTRCVPGRLRVLVPLTAGPAGAASELSSGDQDGLEAHDEQAAQRRPDPGDLHPHRHHLHDTHGRVIQVLELLAIPTSTYTSSA